MNSGSFLIVRRMSIVLLLLYSTNSVSAGAQTIAWKRLIIPDTGRVVRVGMTPTRDGGFALALAETGHGPSINDYYPFGSVRRLNASGYPLWRYDVQPYITSDTFSLEPKDVYELPNGDIQLISGLDKMGVGATFNDKFHVRILSAAGTSYWNSDTVTPIGQIKPFYAYTKCRDGSFLQVWFTLRSGPAFTDTGYVKIIKADSTTKQISTTDILTGTVYSPQYSTYALKQMPDGGYILSFQLIRLSDNRAIGASYLLRLDGTGAKIWGRDISSADTAYFATDLLPTPDGGFVALCWSIKNVADAQGLYSGNTTLIRYGADGSKLWQRDYDTTALPVPRFGAYGKTSFHPIRFAGTKDGGFAITGYSATLQKNSWSEVVDSRDVFVMRTDSAGNRQWVTELNIDSAYMDEPSEIYTLDDGGITVVGVTYELGFRGRVFLVKLNDRISSVESDRAKTGTDVHIWPNPAGTLATIRYTLPQKARLHISVVNALGQMMESYDAGHCEAGEGSLAIRTEGYSAGVYRIRLEAGGIIYQTGFVIIR